MTLHPEVQRKVQEEIDGVTQGLRLPGFEDRQSLPYLHCLLLETLRWNPAVPGGIAHRLTKDDTYRGFDIPEGR